MQLFHGKRHLYLMYGEKQKNTKWKRTLIKKEAFISAVKRIKIFLIIAIKILLGFTSQFYKPVYKKL